MDFGIYTPYLQQLGTALIAGLTYSAIGWFNYWIEQRKLDQDAPWDWKKMAATLTASAFVGLVLGAINAINGQDIGVTYNLLVSVGGISIAKKLAAILWYGKDQVVDLGRRVTGFKK